MFMVRIIEVIAESLFALGQTIDNKTREETDLVYALVSVTLFPVREF
jgi:hypothetical protein